jgi:Leucine-rich repeat (LRR) protein
MNAFNFIILLKLLFITKLSAQDCLFEGCKCSRKLGFNIYCINNNTGLIGFPKRNVLYNNSRPINRLIISGYSFQTIPDESFKNLSLYNLELTNNGLKSITKDAFSGIKDLKSFSVSDKIDAIEEDGFGFVSETLTEVELKNSSIDDKRLRQFMKEIAKIKQLNRLSLVNNLIENLDSELFKDCKSLATLELGYNYIESFNETTFIYNKNLSSLSLDYNNIKNLTSILKSLNVAKNSLNYLDLSGNQVERVESNQFTNLTELRYLIFANASINQIDPDCFANNIKIYWLYLEGNSLKLLPKINFLSNLRRLDLSHQQTQLNIGEYAFRRDDFVNEISLSLEFSKPNLSNKAFSNSYKTKRRNIGYLSLDYETVEKADRCLFTELNLYCQFPPTYLTIESDKANPNKNLSSVCNCEFKRFLSKYQVELGGVCTDTLSELNCNNVAFTDTCPQNSEFKCNKSSSLLLFDLRLFNLVLMLFTFILY